MQGTVALQVYVCQDVVATQSVHGTIALHYSHSAYGAVHGIKCCIAGYCTVRIFCLQLLGTIALQFASMQGVTLESLAADLARKGSGRGRRGRGTARFVRFHGYGGAGPHTPVAVTAARVRPALSPATHTGISQGPATQGHHAPELLEATHAPAPAPGGSGTWAGLQVGAQPEQLSSCEWLVRQGAPMASFWAATGPLAITGYNFRVASGRCVRL